MRFWVDFEAVPVDRYSTLLNGTPNYLEIQEPGGEAEERGLSFTYILPLGPGDFIVASCWGHEFDKFTPFILDPKMGRDWLRAYSEPWPTYGQLVTNASEGRYSSGALINFENPDDGERKWFVITFVGNLVPTNEWAEVFDNPRIVAACQMVYLKSAELAQQMTSGRDISPGTMAKLYAKGFFSGYAEGVNKSLVSFDRIQNLSALAGY